jgi:pimeloyl-ACP methyl ester carboxylesterase
MRLLDREPLPPSQFFTHQGRRLTYRVFGEGPKVLVLAHGLLMDNRMYTGLAADLARRGHRVVAADMFGHGESDEPYEMSSYSMTQFGRDVIALVNHLGLRQAAIGGTSMGANVALEAAA